jgi:hypothetical protein
MKISTRCLLALGLAFIGQNAFTADADPTCADVSWSEGLLEDTPTIAEHCLEMVRRGPEWYARIQAKVVRQGVSSTVVRYRKIDGSWSDSERVYPPKAFSAEVGERAVLISQLAPGQEVNIYASSRGGENFSIPMLEDEIDPESNPADVQPDTD